MSLTESGIGINYMSLTESGIELRVPMDFQMGPLGPRVAGAHFGPHLGRFGCQWISKWADWDPVFAKN